MDKGNNKIYETLKRNNLKITPARTTIIDIFVTGANQLFDVTEIFDLARTKIPHLNFSTVYRNIDVLLSNEVIERINLNGTTKYKLIKNNNHSHHLICKGCHRTEPLPYCPLKDLENSLQNYSDFLPMEHRIEIYGYCKDCQKKIGSKKILYK